MRYRMLLWPHANARYQSETVKLAEAELRLMLDRLAPEAVISANDAADMPSLAIDFPAACDAAVIDALRKHSLLYALFEEREGLLRPVAGRWPARVGSDLPAILKYKGKTNEMFLQLLINVALYSGGFYSREDERLSLLDPMCGRATGLFVAANRGWDAVGADVDKSDLKEAERFFKRYLEYHRFKHTVSQQSRTLEGGRGAALCRFEYAADARAAKEGRSNALSLVHLDAAKASEALGRDVFHIIACDLPYGVRHDAQLAQGANRRGNWLETLLRAALADWRRALKPGGTVALSFNAQNYSLARLRGLMAESGFEVMQGGAYESFSHWVEQAITRDIAVCRKPVKAR
ncbi:MAG: hypothetical protein IJ124_09485 [Clostridia bacterium]|nr:hypothetical protein [Clostridia bacterium]